MRKIRKVEVGGETFEVELDFDGEKWDIKIEDKTFSIKIPDQELDTLRKPKKKKNRKIHSGNILANLLERLARNAPRSMDRFYRSAN